MYFNSLRHSKYNAKSPIKLSVVVFLQLIPKYHLLLWAANRNVPLKRNKIRVAAEVLGDGWVHLPYSPSVLGRVVFNLPS